MAHLQLFLVDRKYKWSKLGEGELQPLERWFDRFESLVDHSRRFVLSALLHCYQVQHQLSKTDADMLLFRYRGSL